KLLPITFPTDFSRANLKVGNSLPDSKGSGTLFMKLGSPAAACPAPPRAAVAAASAAAPVRKSLRSRLDMESPWLRWGKAGLPLAVGRLLRHRPDPGNE